MKKIDPGQAISVLANVGVIAGIVFLAIEIQQNTRSLQMNAYQGLIGQINEFAEGNRENPEIDLLARSNMSLAELTAEESARVGAHLYLIARHGDLAYYQYEQGSLSRERLDSTLGPLNDRLCDPLFRESWPGMRHNFVGAYRDYVDAKMSQCE
jgi:hypothetical protein